MVDLDWSGRTGRTGLECRKLALLASHLTLTTPRQTPDQKKSHGQEYERVYSVPELVVGV